MRPEAAPPKVLRPKAAAPLRASRRAWRDTLIKIGKASRLGRTPLRPSGSEIKFNGESWREIRQARAAFGASGTSDPHAVL